MIQANDEDEDNRSNNGHEEPSKDPMFWSGGEKLLSAVNHRSFLEYNAFSVEYGKKNDGNEPWNGKEDKKHLQIKCVIMNIFYYYSGIVK